MTKVLLALILVSTTAFCAVLNFDVAIGSDPWFGFSVTPHIEFWKIRADLEFNFNFHEKYSHLFLDVLENPTEHLKYFSLDAGDRGVSYPIPRKDVGSFVNLSLDSSLWTFWMLDGAVGGFAGENHGLFFQMPFFRVSIDDSGGFHLGSRWQTNGFFVEAFTSNKGQGVTLGYESISLSVIPWIGFRFICEGENTFFFVDAYGDQREFGIGWFDDTERLLISTETLEFRKKLGNIYFIARFQKGGCYGGFSFPIFW